MARTRLLSRMCARVIPAALVLAREARTRGEVMPPYFDALIAPDQVPAETYRKALRAVAALLPAERCAALMEQVEAQEAEDQAEMAEDGDEDGETDEDDRY